MSEGTIKSFATVDFRIETKDGHVFLPAIDMNNGLYVHRILSDGPNDDPSPNWAISAACGHAIGSWHLPFISFNDFLHLIEEELLSLDWTGTVAEVSDAAHLAAAHKFMDILFAME